MTPARMTSAVRMTSARMTSVRVVVLAMLLGLAGSVSMVAQSFIAGADEGTELASTTVYRVDPEGPSVTVEATYEFTNQTPDRNLGGGRFEYYYYTEIRLPVDDPIDGLAVTVDGAAAEFEQTVVEGVPVLDVQLGRELRYGRTATIVVRYELVGVAPRTDDSFTRVNPAYVSFVVYGFADPGRADVRVELPDDWTVDRVGDDFDSESVQEGLRTFEADDVGAVDDEFFVLFTARRDDRLDSTRVTVSGSDFEIRSWPGDGEWLDYAKRHVVDGVPILERLVGTPWPEAAETDVIEASTPYLRGYAGFYNAADDVIEVGEELDSHTMLHELSHAWFNRSSISDRWVSEGLADEIGARATAELGEPLPDPSDYDDPEEPVDVEPFPLNTWGEPFALDDAEEYYGYRTSFLVMRELRDEIGEEAMTALVAAVLAGRSAYPVDDASTAPVGEEESSVDTGAGGPGDVAAASGSGPVDWREFLDLADHVGGSERIADLYREYVVTDDEAEQLDARDAALALYEPLLERGLGWSPPAVLRTAMERWEFEPVADLAGEAGAALDTRDDLVGVLEPLALVPTDELEQHYETADDIAEVGDELADHLAAAERLAAAQGDLAERLRSVELEVPVPTQGEYDAAPLELAGDVEQLAARAGEVAAVAGLLDATLATHDLTVPDIAPDAFVTSPEDALALLTEQQAAAKAVSDALDARDGAESFVERLGAIGAGVDDRLDEAVSQLADGELDAATTSASDALDEVSGWQDRGATRVLSGLLGIALGLALVLLVRMRGRRRPTAASGDAPEGVDGGDDVGPGGSDDAGTTAGPTAVWPQPVGAPDARHIGDPSSEPPGGPMI